jgi:biopolymer transport protein ExbD
MIGANTIQKGTFVKTLMARSHRKASGKKNLIAGLMLTPMVDMFSLLVIFLLQSFSASPELLYAAKNVSLPNATTGIEVKDAPVLAVSSTEVYLDQKLAGNLKDLLINPEPLMEKLGEQRDLWLRTHPGQDFPGKITLQATRELPSPIVSQLMAMLPSQNFATIQLAVVAGGSEPEKAKVE